MGGSAETGCAAAAGDSGTDPWALDGDASNPTATAPRAAFNTSLRWNMTTRMREHFAPRGVAGAVSLYSLYKKGDLAERLSWTPRQKNLTPRACATPLESAK